MQHNLYKHNFKFRLFVLRSNLYLRYMRCMQTSITLEFTENNLLTRTWNIFLYKCYRIGNNRTYYLPMYISLYKLERFIAISENQRKTNSYAVPFIYIIQILLITMWITHHCKPVGWRNRNKSQPKQVHLMPNYSENLSENCHLLLRHTLRNTETNSHHMTAAIYF